MDRRWGESGELGGLVMKMRMNQIDNGEGWAVRKDANGKQIKIKTLKGGGTFRSLGKRKGKKRRRGTGKEDVLKRDSKI